MLSALPTFALTVLKVPKRFFKEVDKSRWKFLWMQEEELTAGKCKVNWTSMCKPTENGGMGIMDLQWFSSAMRLRWLWLSWRCPDRPSVGCGHPCSEADRLIFNAATTVTLGNGETASFWSCSWTGSVPLRVSFPTLFKHSRRNKRSIRAALSNDAWINDLAHGDTTVLLAEFLAPRRWLSEQNLDLQTDRDDEIKWRLNADGNYSTSSAYQMQFQGTTTTSNNAIIWQAWRRVS